MASIEVYMAAMEGLAAKNSANCGQELPLTLHLKQLSTFRNELDFCVGVSYQNNWASALILIQNDIIS